MKVDSFLIPSALNLIVAQRLVSRLCDSCKKAETASSDLQEIIKSSLDSLPSNVKSEVSKDFKDPYKIYKATGCKMCNNRGRVGRVAIFEIFSMSNALSKIINSGMDFKIFRNLGLHIA